MSLFCVRALWTSETNCNNNIFDANIGCYGMNFKNSKPDDGAHFAVVEYFLPHISVFPSIFLIRNWCWKLISLSCSIHFSSPCDPRVNLRMSTISSNTSKIGSSMYDFLRHSINDGKLPTSFLLNVTEHLIDIVMSVPNKKETNLYVLKSSQFNKHV